MLGQHIEERFRAILREEMRACLREAREDDARASIGDDWLTIAGAAGKLGVSARTIRRHIEAGRLRVYSAGGRTRRVRNADLDALMRAAPAAENDNASLAALAAEIRAK
jgi:excisionase family DNA binding protein